MTAFCRLSTILLSLFAIPTLAAERPNVLLILTDNQAFEELSCHGHPHVKTPHIDAFARESVDFLNFHAPPFCSPSRALLLTGRYAMRSGIHNTIGGYSILHRNEVTIADRLSEAGYRTGIFGKWHLGYSYPYQPQDRGFHEVFVHGGGGIGQLEDHFGNSHLDATYLHNGTFEKSKGFSSDVLFHQASTFIAANKDRPFFCFVSTPATHKPWQAHPEALKRIKARGGNHSKNDLALYSMIENIDDNVGKILVLLERHQLAEKTLVIIATDQGMNAREKGRGLATDGRHRVFCLMRYPPLTEGKAQKNEALTGMVDMAPTLLDLCSIDVPDKMDGRSLRPILAGGNRWTDDRVLIVQCPRGRDRKKWSNAAVKTQRWRLHEGKALFDVVNDPERKQEVSARHPEVTKKLVAHYEEFWNSLPPVDTLRSSHLLGHPKAPTVRLNAMDWYKGGSPWHQLHMPKHAGRGVWRVQVEQEGKYQFELRHYPREAPRALQAVKATVSIDRTSESVPLKATDESGTVTMKLKPGSYDLEAILDPAADNQRKKPWGALFVYVTKLP